MSCGTRSARTSSASPQPPSSPVSKPEVENIHFHPFCPAFSNHQICGNCSGNHHDPSLSGDSIGQRVRVRARQPRLGRSVELCPVGDAQLGAAVERRWDDAVLIAQEILKAKMALLSSLYTQSTENGKSPLSSLTLSAAFGHFALSAVLALHSVLLSCTKSENRDGAL